MPRPRVFLDFAVDNAPYGRVVFELFSDTAPKTCENFRALCTGEKGLSAGGHPLYYKGSPIHRSIKGFMIQGGDFTKRNGTGGDSIYGGTFADEDLQRPLDSPALLCMANKGPNTNGSQFFITLQECPHLNGEHVVFGKVIRGFEDVVLKLAQVPVDDKSRPVTPIIITNCGELELRKRKEPGVDEHSTSRTASEKETTKPRKKRKHREVTPDNIETLPNHLDKKETEEEYDARLEREEAERQEQERKQILLHIKKNFSEESQSTGVRYKGRGRMKYVDPEHQYRT